MERSRVLAGFWWGVVATLAMSVVMIAATITGLSPMPAPIPAALVTDVLGPGLPKPAMMLLAALSHLAYGGVWGAILASAVRPVTIGKGLLLGAILWLIMQVVVLPYLGWGAFGLAITPRIAIATLVLHLIYGAVLGWLADRHVVLTEAPARS
jgi:hypothetical protein